LSEELCRSMAEGAARALECDFHQWSLRSQLSG